MALCTLCGLTCPGAGTWGLCEHHDFNFGDAWSTSNRIVCDFVHRKIVPRRVDLEYRERVDVEDV